MTTQTTPSPLAETVESPIIEHREHTMRIYTEHGSQVELNRLFDKIFNEINESFFDGALSVPYVRMTSPGSPKAYGQYRERSSEGGRSEIDIRPSLLTGIHPRVKEGSEFKEGRILFILDVLIHEIIHLWQEEIVGETEDSYHGHGPLFRDKANEIGAAWELLFVGTKHQTLPQCGQWPHCVRPDDYYQGAYVVPGDDPDDDEPEPIETDDIQDILFDELVRTLTIRYLSEHPNANDHEELFSALAGAQSEL